MKSDYIKLDNLLDYIRGFPIIPYKNHDPHIFSPFQSIYLELLREIPELPGWYAWINRHTDWDNCVLYIGQSQSRKTASISARLNEELLDEHVALWATVHDPESIFRTLNAKSKGKYTKEIKRSLRKAGTTDIIWLAEHTLTDDQLNYVEHMLIKTLHPPANKRKPKFINEYPNLLEEALIALRGRINNVINANGG